jgi:beta-lactam-binding protein with PASTA domain
VTTANSLTVAEGNIISQTPVAGTIVAVGTAVGLVRSLGPAPVTVPNVVGLTETAARAAITGAALTVGAITTATHATIPLGSIISQNPAAGTSAPRNTAVALVRSLGRPPVTVPNVVGLAETAARTAITGATLTVGVITTANHATIPLGSIISQNPAAGTSAPAGSAVALVRSLGPAPVTVPNVVGLTEAAARTAITGATLTVGVITTANHATVPLGSIISQNPAAGTSAPVGAAVALVRSLGPVGVTVPNVVGLTEAAARTAVTGATLTVGVITTANHATVPLGSIISQNPAAGTSAPVGAAVALVRSLGPTVGVDGIAPVSIAPAQNINLSSLPSTTVPVRITWSATDNAGGSGVARYELQRSNNGGTTWAAVTLSTPLTTGVTLTLTPGTTATTNYRFRVRAVDVAGNIGAYATAAAFRLAVTQQNVPAVVYTGTWTTSTDSTASAGSQAFATSAGATATYTFTGRNIAWAAVRANNRGRAEVRVDGTLVATIDLYQSSTTAAVRRVVFQQAVTPGVSHTIQVRVLGTKTAASTGTRVDVDAFVTSQ